MKTLIAVLAGVGIMISASTQAKVVEMDSPNNPNALGVSMVPDAIANQGYGYLAQQQNMAKDAHGYYSVDEPYELNNSASRTASITTNKDIANYLSIQ